VAKCRTHEMEQKNLKETLGSVSDQTAQHVSEIKSRFDEFQSLEKDYVKLKQDKQELDAALMRVKDSHFKLKTEYEDTYQELAKEKESTLSMKETVAMYKRSLAWFVVLVVSTGILGMAAGFRVST